VEFVEPMGAFYFFFRVDGFFNSRLDSAKAFCARLLEKTGVAVVPGEAFGDGRWVRVSYAASDKDLRRALARIEEFVQSLNSEVEE
jgi:aspartate aminotransferase